MTTAVESVRKEITVAAPRERAFEVFTAGFFAWWPKSHHIGEADPEAVVVEPRAGGRWYERAPDGTECEWGTVIAWEPPERVVFGWQLDADWKFDPDLVTEVEVRFAEEGPDRTRVELEHRGLERYGERAEEVRASVGSDGGWSAVLQAFSHGLD